MLRIPNTGTTADDPMLVLMKTGVTSVIAPEGLPVFESGETPPISVTAPTAAVPVVHGAPNTVRLTAAITVASPPAPTTLSGMLRFETLSVAPQSPKRQTFAKPLTDIVPPKPAPPEPAKAPAPLWAVTLTPSIGNVLGSVTSSTKPVTANGDEGTPRLARWPPLAEPFTTTVPAPGITTGASVAIWTATLPVKPRLTALAEPAATATNANKPPRASNRRRTKRISSLPGADCLCKSRAPGDGPWADLSATPSR